MGKLVLKSRHRLLCGDSTIESDVIRLMDKERADVCFTSPPYALGKSAALSGNRTAAKAGNAYDSHQDNPEQWGALIRGFLRSGESAVSYVWVINIQMLAGNKRELCRFIADQADRLVDVAVWDKGHAAPQIAQGVMSSQHEWLIILSASKGASRAIPLASWQGTISNVYKGPPQRGNEYSAIHAATMPTHLPKFVLDSLCDKSKSVYEPFAGSGTTMIVAEQLGRRSYNLEISPQYVDVCVARFEALTGETAVLHG